MSGQNSLSYEEVGALSLDLLLLLQDNRVPMDVAIGGLILSAARLVAGRELSVKEETEAVGEGIDWLALRLMEVKGVHN